jgi:hypothetical protein
LDALEGHYISWEGFGATREEAQLAANRLRRRQLHLLSWLEDDEHGEDDWVRLSEHAP